MSHGPEDDLLPWVVGGIVVLAMTIAVSAVAGSGGGQVVPTVAPESKQLASDSLSETTSATKRTKADHSG